MASHRKRAVSTLQSRTMWSKALLPLSALSLLTLSACQTAPALPTSPVSAQTTAKPVITVPKASRPANQIPATNDDVNNGTENSIEPYVIPKLEQAPDIIPYTGISAPSAHNTQSLPPTPPPHNELLERARQHSQQQNQATNADNSHLPAVQSLMQTGISQLKSGQLSDAETSFTRAQRLAPKSSAVYFYLSQVALSKHQPRKAEAMARRGLSFTKDGSNRRALWQLILRSGQQQNNTRVIKEAQQALR